jgi:hypothetical protein
MSVPRSKTTTSSASIPSGRDAQRRDDAERRSPDGSTPPSRSQGGRAYLAVDMDEGTM